MMKTDKHFDYKRELHYNNEVDEGMHKPQPYNCTTPGTELIPVACDASKIKFYCRM